MIPEPTTAATRKAVPTDSAPTRPASEGFIFADAINLSLDGEFFEACERQGKEEGNSAVESHEGSSKGFLGFF